MKTNMGSADRIIRVVAATVFVALALTGMASGILAIVLSVIGLTLAVTSFIGFCPLYRVFHISTLEEGKTTHD